MSRDCFVWHGCAQAGEPQGYAFKLATGSRGEAKSVREAASAAGLGDVVPTVFGAFVVDIGDGVHVHCFVTLAMEETVSDQVAAWKRVPLTPRLVNDAIAMVCAIIDFMIYAAGARRLGLGGWRVETLGIRGGRLYLMDWEDTCRQEDAPAYRRMGGGMKSFCQSLPGSRNATTCVEEEPMHSWLLFLTGMQQHLVRRWWPRVTCLARRTLPSTEEVRALGAALVGELGGAQRR